MQRFESGRGFDSTVEYLELHRPLTSERSQASTPTLVERGSAISNASSISDLYSSYGPAANDAIWPWWAAQAENILRGSDLQAIQLLCRYRIYKDDSTPESIFREIQPSRLNSFLLDLSEGTYNDLNVADLNLNQKVREILKRLVPSVSVADIRRDLALSTLLLERDATRLASKLNDESSLRFQKITFTDQIGEALYPGRTIESVLDFNDWHDSLFNEVSYRLETFPEEAEKYAQIEQVSAAFTMPVPQLTRAEVAKREPRTLGGLRKPAAITSPGCGACTSARL